MNKKLISLETGWPRWPRIHVNDFHSPSLLPIPITPILIFSFAADHYRPVEFVFSFLLYSPRTPQIFMADLAFLNT